jgi:integrase
MNKSSRRPRFATFTVRPKTREGENDRKVIIGYSIVGYDPHRSPKRIERSLRTKDKKTAYARASEIERESNLGLYDLWTDATPRTGITLNQAAREFMDWQTKLPKSDAARRRDSTLAQFKHLLDLFERNLPPGIMLREIEERHLQTFLFGRGVGNSTASTQLSRLKPFFKWCIKQGYIAESPAARINVKIEARPIVYLTLDEVKRFIRFIRTYQVSHEHHLGPQALEWLISAIILGVGTGMRRSEICHLQWDHVDLNAHTVHVRNTKTFTTKNGKDRSIPLRGIALDRLKTLAESGPCEGYVVQGPKGGRLDPPYLSDRFKFYRRQAGLPEKISFHATRHTFGTELARAGESALKIMQVMGHQNPEVTLKYLHLLGTDAADSIGRAFNIDLDE